MSRRESARGGRTRSESSQSESKRASDRAPAELVAESATSLEASLETTFDLAELLEPESKSDLEPDGPAASAPVHARSRWRALLAGASPREVLARLVPGDPLQIRALVAERTRSRSYLVDADRVFLRAVARTARFAVRYRGQPDVDAWLAGLVDEALLDVLRDEFDAEGSQAPAAEGELAAFVDLGRPLGLDPAAMRGACARFNRLPEDDRAAFFALLVDARELDEAARAMHQSPTDLARAARRAFEVFWSAAQSRPDAPSSKEPS